MISSSIRSLIFHILFTTTVGNVSVKILQINLSNDLTDIRDNLKCGINYSKSNSDILDFIQSHKPDVVLWLSNCRLGYVSFIEKIKSLKLNVVILPLLSYENVQKCYDYPENKSHANCYYANIYRYSKLKFLIMNTCLWTKQSVDSEQQFNWLSQNLHEAETHKQHVIIVGYKSPGSLEITNGSLNYAFYYNEKLVELFVKYSNTIKGCLFGNKNIDTFRVISNKKKIPILPMFISPLSSNKYVRVYTYNQTTNALDNYMVYQKNQSNNWMETFNCKTSYGLHNMSASSWFVLAESFLNIASNNFKIYQSNSLRNDIFEKYCKSNSQSNKTNCIKCRSHCFIMYLKKDILESCLKRCAMLAKGIGSLVMNEDFEQNSILFVFAVIAGFVIILVGIVLAVNKVYCIRRGRQRNIFLAPLTLNIQAEIVDDNQNLNLSDKVPSSKDDVDNNQVKNSNGYRRSNHDVEQTYNYIRM